MVEAWVLDLLKTAEVIHLATLKKDGAPVVRPVNFLYREGKIYVHTGPGSGKIEQIRRDPRVYFEIERIETYIPAKDTPCSATYSCRSVGGEGIATVVTNDDKKQKVLQEMMEKYQPEGGVRPVSLKDVQQVAIIEIRVQNLSAFDHIRGGR